MITSVANRSWPGDIMVSDLPAAGLPASIVRPAKERVIQLGFIVPLLHIRFPGAGRDPFCNRRGASRRGTVGKTRSNAGACGSMIPALPGQREILVAKS